MFILYINDLPDVISGCKILYADDTAIFYSAKSVSEIQSVLNFNMAKVKNW